MRMKTIARAAFGTLALLALAEHALALGSCNAKVDRNDGTIRFRASGAIGNVRWGALEGAEKQRFDNEGSCVAGASLSDCRIAPAGSLAAATPTHSCDFYLRDDGGSGCTVHIKRCTPGLRGDDLASAFPGIDLDVLAALSLEVGPLGIEHVVVTGVNLQVVDGSGDTYTSPRGRGNVIVGYDEGPAADKRGSHNVVIGPGHRYADAVGGLVAGRANTIANTAAVVVGGENNHALGLFSTVVAGEDNVASGHGSVVAGGRSNTASGIYSVVSGGSENTASGQHAGVFGGRRNLATNALATVCGGGDNRASGPASSVIGGQSRTATTNRQTICAPSTN